MTERLRNPGTVSTLYSALSHSRRRYVLHRLREAERSMALADLAEDVAEWEADARASEIAVETVEDVHLTLYRNHVHRFEDAELVRFDPERDAVALAERSENSSSTTVPDRSPEDDDRA